MALVCANCGIEIRWQPTRVAGVVYCCVGCSQGGPCTCDYEHLPPPEAQEVSPQDSCSGAADTQASK